MQEFSGHLYERGWKAEAWKPKKELTGLLHQKGWRSEAWKPRKFVLKGKILICYLGDSMRSQHLIDAESFVSVVNRDDRRGEIKERGDKGDRGDRGDGGPSRGTNSRHIEEHRFIFTIRTKNITAGYSKNKITLSAPNEHSLNSWLEALSECAFEGQRISIPYLWPKIFRNQTDLFTISYSGRNVDKGTVFKAFQVEGAPFATYSDKKPSPLKELPQNNLRGIWAYSNTASSLEAAPSEVTSQNVPVLKLYYTLIMLIANTDDDDHDDTVRKKYLPVLTRTFIIFIFIPFIFILFISYLLIFAHYFHYFRYYYPYFRYFQCGEFSMLWMVTNIRSNAKLSADTPNGQEVSTLE